MSNLRSRLFTFIFICCFLLDICLAWRRYEEPLVVATPNQNGVYEFTLEVSPELSMSTVHMNGELQIHDYNPESMSWVQRDKGQLNPCMRSTTLVDQLNYTRNEIFDLAQFGKAVEKALPDLLQLNGRHLRLSAVNKTVPGPTLVVPFGAEVLVRIKNRLLLDSVTLHFHGLEMRGNWFNDGVAYLQQCPIPVRSDYAIRFTADRVGTHWYHGQFPRHESNGILGAFVVLPNEKVDKVDVDYVALLQDWPIVSNEEQEFAIEKGANHWLGSSGYDKYNDDRETCQAQGNARSVVGKISAILVNGKGWHSTEDLRNIPEKLPLTTFQIKRDQNVRLRFIHGGYKHPLVVSLEDHKMSVIATDGTDVEPRGVDAILMYPGERYDILVKTLSKPKQNTYRIVVGTASIFTATVPPIYGLANLEYSDVPGTAVSNKKSTIDFGLEKCKEQTKCVVLNCPISNALAKEMNLECLPVHKLQPVKKQSGEKIGDFEEYFINMNPLLRKVDGYTFNMPNQPVFKFGKKVVKENGCNANEFNVTKPNICFYFKRFILGNVIQVTFYNFGITPENTTSATIIQNTASIHLHGVHFEVLKIGYPIYSEKGVNTPNADITKRCEDQTEAHCQGVKWTNASWANGNVPGMSKSPIQKDTIVVPFGGYTVIRFRADNPGWWLAEAQNINNLRFAFAIGEDSEIPKPPKGFPSDCGVFEPKDIFGADIKIM